MHDGWHMTLAAIQAMPEPEFAAVIAPVRERDVGDGRAGGHALFASITVLHAAVVARLHRTTEAEQLAFLRDRPMLSPPHAAVGYDDGVDG